MRLLCLLSKVNREGAAATPPVNRFASEDVSSAHSAAPWQVVHAKAQNNTKKQQHAQT